MMYSTSHLKRPFVMLCATAALIIVAVFGAGYSPADVQAQLSCDDPPINVSGLTSVWDKTDFCQYQEGVFDEILSGGVGRDGIPPIDNPNFESIVY